MSKFYTEDSDGLFRTPDGHVFGQEIMKDIDASFDAILSKPRQTGLCNTALEMSNEAWAEWANRNGIFIAHDPFDETGSTMIIKDGKIIKQC